MSDGEIPNGTECVIEGRLRVHYDGYWIKAYPVPSDSLLEKRRLIEVLTRRLFNHVEHGLNVPGCRLDEARHAYEAELDPPRKRVKAGMLAGALFNRAAEVLTKLVELQAAGVEVTRDTSLMRVCGSHLSEALELGKLVLHRSGEEGIDELWGEPFKAFAFPVADFYESRYVKVAMTMRAIDAIAAEMCSAFAGLPPFAGIDALLSELGPAACLQSETLRADPDVFDVWASFAVALEKLRAMPAKLGVPMSEGERQCTERGVQLVREGVDLIDSIARARVPMPKSTAAYIERCRCFREAWSALASAAQRERSSLDEPSPESHRRAVAS